MKVYSNRYFNIEIMNKIVEYAIDDVRHNRANTVEEAVRQNADDVLIYTSDQWEIMEEYQSPETADWSSALEDAISDMISAIDVEDEWFEDDEEAEDNEPDLI